MPNQTKKPSAAEADAFCQFSRNGRWGTCGDCPRDTHGHAYPEFCEHTSRADHQLSIEDLAGWWERLSTR